MNMHKQKVEQHNHGERSRDYLSPLKLATGYGGLIREIDGQWLGGFA
jgi:hypothetical protein